MVTPAVRWAKIKNGRIVDVVNGLQPPGYVQVNIKWTYPEDYPRPFYAPDSNKPILTIVDDGASVDETWSFTLRPISQVQDVIYEDLRLIRWELQLGNVDFDGDSITLKDREDAVNIANLPDSAINYKAGQNDWVEGVDKIAALKVAAKIHTQEAFDYEITEDKLVEAMTTHDELKVYYEALPT